MDTQNIKSTPALTSEEVFILTKQARAELERDMTTTVICPKCYTHPKLTVAPDKSRSKICCKCGYLRDGEIYL